MVEAVKPKHIRSLSSGIFYHVLLILVFGYIAYGLFFVSAIYSDDWDHVIERPVTINANWLDINNRRPLLFTPFLIQNKVFGVNVTAYYIVLWGFQIVLSVLVYMIANRFAILRQYSLSVIIALLFLVYPTNYTHMWLTMISASVTLGLALIYGYLLLVYADGARTITLLAALFFLIVSFGIYEAQLGVICAWPLILLLTHRQLSTTRRLLLLLPILVGVIYIIWRTWGQQSIGVTDSYLSQMSITPGILLSRLLLGYKVSLFWGWATTIRWFLPWISANSYAILLLAILVIVLWGTLRQTGHSQMTQNGEITDSPIIMHRWLDFRFISAAGIVGLFLIGAGYLPIIAVVLPNLSGNGAPSRVNLFASIGSAIFLACVLMVGALLFSKTRLQVKHLFIVSVVPLLLIGTVTQASVQYENRAAWHEQQAIWKGIFLAAPNFKDDTFVLLVLPGFQDRVGYQNWRRTPLHAFWDLSSGLRILYDNPTLSGDIIFTDIAVDVEPTLTSQGIVNQESKLVTSYNQAVVFVYNNGSKTVYQLDELSAELINRTGKDIKLCTNCVIEGPPPDVPLRRLIQD